MKLPPPDQNQFTFKFFTPEEIDRKFASILDTCESLFGQKEIAEEIHRHFENQMFLILRLDENYGKLKLYRITVPYDNINIKDPKGFSYPPKKEAKMGRANIAEHPVFYGSMDPLTAMREMKDKLSIGAEFYISEWEIDYLRPINAHFLLINSTTISGGSITTEIALSQLDSARNSMHGLPDEVYPGFKRYLERAGDLFTLPSENRYYKISSAYAHEVLYTMRELERNVDALFYPSVVAGHDRVNVALHPDFADSDGCKLKTVFRLLVKEIKDKEITVTTSQKGVNQNGAIHWLRPSIRIDNVDFDNLVVHTYDGCVFKGIEAADMQINNSQFTVRKCLQDSLDAYLINGLQSLPFQGDIFNFESAQRSHQLIIECKHGWRLETGKNDGCIRYFIIPFYWTEEYVSN